MLSAKSVNNGSIDFTDCRWVEPSAFDLERKRGDVTAGDVLLTIVGTIGRCAVVPIDRELVILQRSVALLRPKRLLDSKFLSFQLQGPSLQAWMVDNARGVAQLGLYLGSLKKLPLWCPTPPTQHRIVAEIEEKLSRLDAAQSALLRAQANLKRYRSSVLISSFNVNKNFLPTGWKLVNLMDLCDVVRGGSPRPAGDPRYFGGTVPWITVGTVTSAYGKFVDFASDGLTDTGKERSRYIESGTLLLTNSGATLGVPKITRISGCINDGVAALLNIEEPLKSYLLHFLTSQTDNLRSTNQGAAQPNLNTSIIKAIRVPLAPRDQIGQIVAETERRLSVIDRTEQTLRTQLERAKRLRQSILQQAFSPTSQDA
jgi:type I restriction enzyme, S subunit